MIEKIPTDKYCDNTILKVNEIIDHLNTQNPAVLLGKKRWHDISTDKRAKAMAKVRAARGKKVKVMHK